MKAFVTGGTGLLGGNLVRLLLEKGHQVKILARSQEKAQRLHGDLPVEVVVGDLGNVSAFAAELEGCDVVFHTAAYFREYYQPGDHWPTLKKLNVDATLELIKASREAGVGRFVHTSSEGVLAKVADQPSDESSDYNPFAADNLYFKSKVEAEKEIYRYLAEHDQDVVMVLPGWMIGPGDAGPTGSGQFILDIANKALPALFNGGTSTVDARDVAIGMLAVAEQGKSGERYLVAGRYQNLEQVAQAVGEVTGVKVPGLRLPYPVMYVYAWLCELWSKISGRPTTVTLDGVKTMNEHKTISSAKAVQEFGLEFRPLQETVSDTVDWFRENGFLGNR